MRTALPNPSERGDDLACRNQRGIQNLSVCRQRNSCAEGYCLRRGGGRVCQHRGAVRLRQIHAFIHHCGAGEIRVDGETLRGVSRKIGYMPQKDQLFPWRSIWDNVTLGLELQRQRDGAHLQRVKELLERYGLGQFAQRAPGQLSGGMRQRCALIPPLASDVIAHVAFPPWIINRAGRYRTISTISSAARAKRRCW